MFSQGIFNLSGYKIMLKLTYREYLTCFTRMFLINNSNEKNESYSSYAVGRFRISCFVIKAIKSTGVRTLLYNGSLYVTNKKNLASRRVCRPSLKLICPIFNLNPWAKTLSIFANFGVNNSIFVAKSVFATLYKRIDR